MLFDVGYMMRLSTYCDFSTILLDNVHYRLSGSCCSPTTNRADKYSYIAFMYGETHVFNCKFFTLFSDVITCNKVHVTSSSKYKSINSFNSSYERPICFAPDTRLSISFSSSRI